MAMEIEGRSVERGAPSLAPAQLEELRPHLVNLTQGQLSTGGSAKTGEADINTIFSTHLPKFAAARGGKPVPLMLYAHGGLVDERSGLLGAHGQLRWWLDNGVYPVFFVWETGLADALKQIFSGFGLGRGFGDKLQDKLAEEFAHAAGGTKVWGAMKYFAELSSRQGGGAHFFLRRLAEFMKAHPNSVKVHAVGHSAGAIFHANLIGAAAALKVPPLETLQYLAPAIRVDTFMQLVKPALGKQVGPLTMYTMKREFEEADNCAFGSVTFYHRSLLYLIYEALEAVEKTPILGLEGSIVIDDDLQKLFAGTKASVVWSQTAKSAAAGSRTRSTSHGGFDNDAATMESVAFRILGKAPKAFPIEAQERAWGPWTSVPFPLSAITMPGIAPIAPASPALPAAAPVVAGRRTAVCVGIDAYPDPYKLGGCVADATTWQGLLKGMKFDTSVITNAQATRENILNALKKLVGGSKPGDVIVFQYSGHGTEVADLDGDEVGGTNGAKDEALCPVDFARGALLIDDDIAKAFGDLPAGVNLTCFLDCCHSGSATRVIKPGGPAEETPPGLQARFVRSTPELEEAHKQFREGLGESRAVVRPFKAVTVSACQDFEVAWESAGQGEFTTRARDILSAGAGGLTNQEFVKRVVAAFGAGRRQTPTLDAAKEAYSRPLLAPLTAPARRDDESAPAFEGADVTTKAAVARLLRSLADVLELP